MRPGSVAWFGPIALAAAALLGCGTAPSTGSWRAWLDSPGGELPFGLELRSRDDGIEAVLVNGAERISVPRVELDGDRLVLGIDHYDSSVHATLSADGTRLDGHWRKTVGSGREATLPFHALAGDSVRFPADGAQGEPAGFGGRWAVEFEKDDLPAVGIFETSQDGSAAATFLTATGDYRYLAGNVHGDRMRLSVFDGAHAFLFDARLLADGSIEGEFWSRDSWHETWTATRDDGAEVPDAFSQTSWVGDVDLASIRFPDLQGNLRSLADPEFDGHVRILELFGSWCPNCNDASTFLVELDRRYRSRGLRILGLAFEVTGDFERDAAQLGTYIEHHGIEYPVLVAGTADKAEASRAFPWIDRLRAYPTAVFLDREGRVRAVHSGFAGPATGEAHLRLRARYETLIEGLLEGHDPADSPAGAEG